MKIDYSKLIIRVQNRFDMLHIEFVYDQNRTKYQNKIYFEL